MSTTVSSSASQSGRNGAAQRTKTRGGRPTKDEAEALELRLREAALDVFVEQGFDGATMEAIASAAGTTKRTLYSRFADKRELFLTVVPWALARMPMRGVAIPVPDGDLESALRELALDIISRLVDPQAVKLRRLAVSEAHRFPEFAQEANMDLWVQSVRSVTELLEAHAVSGAIVIDDIRLAADQFLVLVAGGPTILADFGVFRSADDTDRSVRHAVKLFLTGVLPR